MPIKDIQTRGPRLSRLGIIRLGTKHPEKGYPMDCDHFVLTDAPDLAAAYGEQPQELLIYLPFDEVDADFPAHHELWSATGCLCRGDGERIVDRLDGTARVIRGGQVLQPFVEQDGTQYGIGDVVACPGLDRTPDLYPRCADCRPRGMLIVMVRDPERPTQLVADRLGYYQVSTHSYYNIQNLTGQLEYAARLAAQMGRGLRGIPMILRRTPREIVYTDAKKNERRTVKKALLDLEFDLQWVRLANATMHQLALQPTEVRALPATIIDAETGEIIEEYDDLRPPIVVTSPGDSQTQAVQRLQQATHGIRTSGIRGTTNGKRPYTPAQMRARWDELLPAYQDRYESDEGSIEEGLRGAMCGKLNGYFGDWDEPDKHRRTFLAWLTGKDSATQLSQAEGRLLAKLLEDGHAVTEVRAVVRQDAVDRGQQTLPLPEETTEL